MDETGRDATARAGSAEMEEILDREGLDPVTVERALDELSRVNRLLLGYRPVVRAVLPRLLAGEGHAALLDVGTGSGDVVGRLAEEAARRGRRTTVIGVDRKLTHLLVGRRRHPEQLRVVADARELPFREGAVEWSLSSLFFHHFDAADNRAIVAEMVRVARVGAAVVDLRASRLGRRLGRLLVPLTGAGPITRHDGRVSLAKAWPLDRVAELAGETGLEVLELRKRFPFRFSLLLRPGRGPRGVR